MFEKGELVALSGPGPWACRVVTSVDVPHGGVGPLYPLGDHWSPGRWYFLQRLWLLDLSMKPWEELAVSSTVKVYDGKLLDYRRATPAELLERKRFIRVWAHEHSIEPMPDLKKVPLGCLFPCDLAALNDEQAG